MTTHRLTQALEHRAYERLLTGDRPRPGSGLDLHSAAFTTFDVTHQVGTGDMCIVTHSTASMDAYADLSAKNIGAYAQRHGYHFFRYRGHLTGLQHMDLTAVIPAQRYGLFWQSVAAVEHVLSWTAPDSDAPLCQWVMWVDGDTLITEPTRSLAQVLAPFAVNTKWNNLLGPQVVIAREEFTPLGSLINAGVYFVHNTPAGNTFIDTILALFDAHRGQGKYDDQDAMHHYLLNLDPKKIGPTTWADVVGNLRQDVAVVPASTFNAFYLPGEVASQKVGYWHPGDFLAHFAGMTFECRLAAMRHVFDEVQAKVDPSQATVQPRP